MENSGCFPYFEFVLRLMFFYCSINLGALTSFLPLSKCSPPFISCTLSCTSSHAWHQGALEMSGPKVYTSSRLEISKWIFFFFLKKKNLLWAGSRLCCNWCIKILIRTRECQGWGTAWVTKYLPSVLRPQCWRSQGWVGNKQGSLVIVCLMETLKFYPFL